MTDLPSETFALIVCLVALLSVPVVYALLKTRRVDLFLPPVIFGCYILLGYVLPIPSFVHRTDPFSDEWPIAFSNLEDSLTKAIIVVILGVVGFYIGFFILSRTRSAERNSQQVDAAMHTDEDRPFYWDHTRFLKIAILYTGVGCGLFLVAVLMIGGPGALLSGLGDRIRLFEGLNYLVLPINLLIVISLLWWAYLLITGRSLFSIAFWIYATLSVLAVSFEGNKSTIFIFIVSLVLMYHLLRRRIPALVLTGGAVVVFTLLTFYALFMREYMAVGEFVTLDTRALTVDSLVDVVDNETRGNFMQIQCLTILTDKVPADLPFQNGRTFLSLLTMAIPAAVWPDKPLPSTGIFTIAFWPYRWFSEGTTMPPGLLGEMFMNFGSAGAFFGMMLFGLAYGFGEQYVRRRRDDLGGLVLYALFVALMPAYLRGEFVSPSIALIILGTPAVIAARFIQHPRQLGHFPDASAADDSFYQGRRGELLAGPGRG